jgi:hypothetical protein
LTPLLLSDTDKSSAMEFSKEHRKVLASVQQVRPVAISICISMIRIIFEQHAGA